MTAIKSLMIIQWVIQMGFKSNDRFSQMSEPEEPAVLLPVVGKPPLRPGNSPSKLLRAKTRLKNDPGEEQSGPCIFNILCKMCRSGRDPLEDWSSSLNDQN